MNKKDKLIKRTRKIIQRIQPIYTRFRKKRHVLLFCDSITMEEHIIDYYENVKDIHNLCFYLFYVDAQNNYEHKNLESGRKRIVDGRNIKVIYKYSNVVFHFWNLIVCADTFLPFRFTHRDAPAIYVNHGLHIISLDGGNQLYAYTDGWALDSEGMPKFAAMFEPNKRYVEILKKEKPILKNVIYHVGYKYSDRIIKEKNNYIKYRKELNINDEETVISVFSTWRKESLFQRVGKELIAQCKELQNEGYRFILSDHPREYFKYDKDIEPSGPYVDSLSKEGFIVRHPDEDYMKYLICADVVICDYSTFYELALLADKKVILSDFPAERVWKYSIARELMNKLLVFKKDTNLKQILIEAMESKSYQQELKRYGKELLNKNGYKNSVQKITKDILW